MNLPPASNLCASINPALLSSAISPHHLRTFFSSTLSKSFTGSEEDSNLQPADFSRCVAVLCFLAFSCVLRHGLARYLGGFVLSLFSSHPTAPFRETVFLGDPTKVMCQLKRSAHKRLGGQKFSIIHMLALSFQSEIAISRPSGDGDPPQP
jgi:hypothetical protein